MVDGDQLNVVTEEPIISAAKRNRDTMDIVPLFYDANKAKPQYITIENLYLGLKQAHDFSNIGQISNMLTRLWNKDCPNYDAAKLLTMYNNYVIDAAKTGFVNSYADHKESKEIVSKAIGGKIGRMPHFFQFSKNGRHQSKENMSKKRCFLKPNNSTMNRIWKSFTDIGNINMNYAEVKPFNWMMLMPSCVNDINMDAINVFCSLDDSNIANMIKASSESSLGEREEIQNFELLSDMIAEELRDKFGSLEECYPSIVKYLFTGDNAQKQAHKQMFWRVFGDLACGYIGRNIVDCHICNKCGMKIPNWYPVHTCSKDITGFVTCVDCGKIVVRRNSRQIRCPGCQEKQKTLQSKLRMQRYRDRKRYG